MQQDAQSWQCGLGGGGGLLGAPGPRGPALTRAGLGFLAVATGTQRPPAGRAPDLSAVGSVPCFSTRHSQPRGAPFNLLSVSHFGSLMGGGFQRGPFLRGGQPRSHRRPARRRRRSPRSPERRPESGGGWTSSYLGEHLLGSSALRGQQPPAGGEAEESCGPAG